MEDALRIHDKNRSYYETIIGISGATRRIADIFRAKRETKKAIDLRLLVDLLGKRLSLYPLVFPSIPAIVEVNPELAGHLPQEAKNLVMLLSARYSGSLTADGYNPEGDSDVVGQSQIAKELEAQGFVVITIGHDNAQNTGYHSKYHLGEFYKRHFLEGTGRLGQLSFFQALMQYFPRNSCIKWAKSRAAWTQELSSAFPHCISKIRKAMLFIEWQIGLGRGQFPTTEQRLLTSVPPFLARFFADSIKKSSLAYPRAKPTAL